MSTCRCTLAVPSSVICTLEIDGPEAGADKGRNTIAESIRDREAFPGANGNIQRELLMSGR